MLTFTNLTGTPIYVMAAFIMTVQEGPASTMVQLASGHFLEVLESVESIVELLIEGEWAPDTNEGE